MIVFSGMQFLDWPGVKKIYEEGIATGNATFEQNAPSWEEWDKNHLPSCRLIAKKGETILGWAALTPVSARSVYAGVAEVSIYISSFASGKGLGKMLLQKLITESEALNIWTLQAGIFPENKASIKIHTECGFRMVGYREKIGMMNGIWRDTYLFERRSKNVGIN